SASTPLTLLPKVSFYAPTRVSSAQDSPAEDLYMILLKENLSAKAGAVRILIRLILISLLCQKMSGIRKKKQSKYCDIKSGNRYTVTAYSIHREAARNIKYNRVIFKQKEGTKMKRCVIAVASVTDAIRLDRLLGDKNIKTELQKIDPSLTENGCAYGIKIPCSRTSSANKALQYTDVNYKILAI
ncbi:MAG: DUF3343 domain-containing protein, partial [Clostridia bacterium]|nr:DUF3343 domain-containing protein [Clostridia bacterium]